MTCLINKYTAVLFGLSLALLSSCSNLKTATSIANEQWAFIGKVAIRNAQQASSFNVDWQQNQGAYRIVLTGPLGQGEVTITGNKTGAVLRQGDNIYHANNLTQLVYETTALDLPLEELMYWVTGKAYPLDKALTQTNAQGQTTSIQQADWTVSISAYFEDQPNQPRKLSFERASNSGKLIIRQWYTATSPIHQTSL